MHGDPCGLQSGSVRIKADAIALWLVNQMVMEIIWDVSGIRVFMR